MAAALSLVQILSMLAMMVIYTSEATSDFAFRPWRAARAIARSQFARRDEPICRGMSCILLDQPCFCLRRCWHWFWQIVISPAASSTARGYGELLEQRSRASLLFIAPIGICRQLPALRAHGDNWRLWRLGLITSHLWANRPRPLLAKFSRSPVYAAAGDKRCDTWIWLHHVALDEPPLNLRSSWLIIPISHTLVALALRHPQHLAQPAGHPALAAARRQRVLGASPPADACSR